MSCLCTGLARVALRDVRSDPLDHRQKPGKDLQPEIIKFKSSVFSSPPDSVMGRCMLHVPAFVSDNFLHVQDGLYIRNFPQHIQSQLLEIERTVDGTEADRLALLYMVGLLLFQDCVQQGMTGMEEQLVDVMYDGLSVQGTAMRIAMDYAADSPDDILDDIPDDIPDDSPDDISGMLDMLNDVNSLDVSGQLTYTMQLDAHTRQLYYEALKHDVFSMARKRGTATESQKNWFVQVVHRAHQDIEICESKVSDFNTYVRRCMVEDGFAVCTQPLSATRVATFWLELTLYLCKGHLRNSSAWHHIIHLLCASRLLCVWFDASACQQGAYTVSYPKHDCLPIT